LIEFVDQIVERASNPVGTLNDTQPVVGLAQLLGRDPQLVQEVCAALGAPCFLVVRATARCGAPELCRDVLRGRIALQRRQQPSHELDRIEYPARDVVPLARPGSPTVLRSLFLVPCSLFLSPFHPRRIGHA